MLTFRPVRYADRAAHSQIKAPLQPRFDRISWDSLRIAGRATGRPPRAGYPPRRHRKAAEGSAVAVAVEPEGLVQAELVDAAVLLVRAQRVPLRRMLRRHSRLKMDSIPREPPLPWPG